MPGFYLESQIKRRQGAVFGTFAKLVLHSEDGLVVDIRWPCSTEATDTDR